MPQKSWKIFETCRPKSGVQELQEFRRLEADEPPTMLPKDAVPFCNS